MTIAEATIIVVIITITSCSVTNVTKDGQRKETSKYNKKNFLNVIASEATGKSRPNSRRWYAGALHNPRSVKNSKVTSCTKYYMVRVNKQQPWGEGTCLHIVGRGRLRGVKAPRALYRTIQAEITFFNKTLLLCAGPFPTLHPFLSFIYFLTGSFISQTPSNLLHSWGQTFRF